MYSAGRLPAASVTMIQFNVRMSQENGHARGRITKLFLRRTRPLGAFGFTSSAFVGGEIRLLLSGIPSSRCPLHLYDELGTVRIGGAA